MAFFLTILGWIAQALIFLLLLLFIACLCYCLYIKHIHGKFDHIPGPPRDSFLLGHMPTLSRIMRNDGIVHDKFLEWSEIYGSVYRLNALHYTLICVTSPEATKEILMSPKYTKDSFLHNSLYSMFGQRWRGMKIKRGMAELQDNFSSLKQKDKASYAVMSVHSGILACFRFLGNGLVTVRDHSLWYKQRRIMDPAFSSLYLRGLMGNFNDTAEKLMDKLSDFADNKTEAKMLHLFNCVTMEVIAKVAFGVDLDLLNKSSPFPRAVEICLKGMVYNIRDIFFAYIPKNWPFINEVKEACRLLRYTGAQWIHDRKTSMQSGIDVPKDILTQIIKSAGKEENMAQEDEEVMLDNFVTFFIAGQETTANQLAFCTMELGRHPDILDKLKKEVDEVIGMKKDISYEDLGQLVYLSQVLKETLRMYPTAPGTSRDLIEDTVIDGIHVPGGAICIFETYITGRMDKFFKDPMTFDPERFHPDAPKPYYCYFPFSLGPRSCLGQNFAQMEAKVVMAKLLQRFDFTLLPGETFDMTDNGTLRPKSGVLCSVRHRDHRK